MINYFSENVKSPQIKRRETSAWIKSAAEKYGKKIGGVSYIFCDDKKILEINRQYLQHDYFTDIITFDYSENNVLAGDIFISLDTVKSNSEKYNTLYGNELHRVIIHGILHLCGLKDKTEKDAKIMRKAENDALEQLKNIVLLQA